MKAQFTITLTFDDASAHEPTVAMALAKAAVHVATKSWRLMSPDGEYPSGAVRELVSMVRSQRPGWQFRGAQSMSCLGFEGDRGKTRTTISVLFGRPCQG